MSVERACAQRTQTCRGTTYTLVQDNTALHMSSEKPTSTNEGDSRQADDSGFGLVWTTDLSALHADQSKDRAKETETDSSDHQSPAHLDIT